MLRNHIKKLGVNIEARIQIAVILLGYIVPFVLPFVLQYLGISIGVEKDDFSEGWLRILYQVYLELGKYGKYLASIVLGTFLWWKFRKRNHEIVFNKGNSYKDYSYAEYWLCAKILGYSKCNLERVPIYKQFQLIRRDTFNEYYVGEMPTKEDLEIGQCWLKPLSGSDKEVNLMIADTYPLSSGQLPVSKNSLATVKIYRQNQNDHRYFYITKLVDSVLNTVRNLPSDVEQLNIFATTNPKNTYEIVRKVFKSGERDKIRVLMVFQQHNSGLRKFEDKGRRV